MSEELNIPESWEEVLFSDVCDIISGKNQKQVEDENGEFPIYGSGGKIGNANEYLCEPGTTIIGRKGTINSPIYVRTKFWNVDTAFGLSPFQGYNSSLFYYYCLSFNFKKLDKSTTIPSLAKVDLFQIGIPLPPLPEQHRIVAKVEELFCELDNGVNTLKLEQKQLKLYRQALLKQAFEGKLTQEWRKQRALSGAEMEPANELLERIKLERQKRYEQELEDWKEAVKQWEKDGKLGKRPSKPKLARKVDEIDQQEVAQLNDIPSLWNYGRLANLGILDRGKSKHRPRNDERLFGGDYPFIQTAEVRNSNVVIKSYEKTYSNFGLQQSKIWNKGTLCITIAANIAETAFLGFDACFPDSVVGYIPENGTSDKYIFYFLEYSRKKIEEFAPATAQKNINLNILDNIYIPVCSLLEQKELVRILEEKFAAIDNLEQTIESSLKKSEALRQSILKKAFHGGLVPQEPKDEPASELLKRIKEEKEKYMAEEKANKKQAPKKTKKMKESLLDILKDKFKGSEFTFEDLKTELSIPYEEFRTQFFELLDKKEKVNSRFDEKKQEIRYTLK